MPTCRMCKTRWRTLPDESGGDHDCPNPACENHERFDYLPCGYCGNPECDGFECADANEYGDSDHRTFCFDPGETT